MIDYPAALRFLMEHAPALPAERVPLAAALGRVSAEEHRSRGPVPPFASSAMDGFAVRSAATAGASASAPRWLEVLGGTAAGEAPALASRGAADDPVAWRIMTGAAIPAGYDSVIPIEKVEVERARIAVRSPARAGDNVRSAAEDFAAGDRVLAPGTVLAPAHLAALAATGHDHVAVVREADARFVATGNELVSDAGAELEPGQIRDSNTPLLRSTLAIMGLAATELPPLRDDPDAFIAVLRRQDSGLLISTGAVSAGDADFVPSAVRAAGGTIVFHKVAIKPGKPILFARLASGALMLGLPGNPVSVAVGLRFFLSPLLRAMQGRPPERARTARLTNRWSARGGLAVFLKASVSVDEHGALRATISDGQESHRLATLAASNAWVLAEPEQTRLEAGDEVKVVSAIADRWVLE